MAEPTSSEPRPADPPVNRLGNESSAYLRQHRFNPVDWEPWGPEALQRAREQDRPLLVSIGYSACHWCHVMERESFENPEIARLMNESFVNVKVDREERPDIDQIYMDAALRLHGHGGWPLHAICTPDGRPFYIGTYFPPERRGGMPAFPEVIEAVMRAWREQRDEIEQNADQIAAVLSARPEGAASHEVGPETLRSAARTILQSADAAHGGFGRAPKFPTPTNLELLIAALDFLDEEEATRAARFLAHTAREMARRGLFDQLGGGFHRYCVDASWTIPHFEKMLYDQGQLLSVYAELARRSHDTSDLLWPIRETVEYLRREMRAEDGASHASQDADSEGVEGRFFVWTPAEIEEVLGPEADAFCTAYGVRPQGNFEHGTTHLVDEARAPRARFAEARARLLERRSTRVPPATDPKRVAAWNGYVISGLARASVVTGDASMLADGLRAATFVLDEMIDEQGTLHRVYDESGAHVPGFLDDHASLLVACLDLQRAGAGNRLLEPALWLARAILERFADRETGALYLTSSNAEPLIHRPRSDRDGATPDAAGLALLGLSRVAALSGAAEIEAFVEAAIREQGLELERAPSAFPTLLRAVALRARGMAVAVIVGEARDAGTRALADRARRVLRPEDAVVVVAPGEPTPLGVDSEWLRGREAVDGRPTAYLCHGSHCSLPIQDPARLVAGPESET
jgi:uncharacterized protein YyaL (SSP411 family)